MAFANKTTHEANAFSAPQRPASALARYGQAVAGELVLVVVMSLCLSMVALQGFVVDPQLQYNGVLLGALSLLLQLVLYGTVYRKRNYAPGIAIYLVLCAAIIGLGMATSTGVDIMADTEENHLTFAATVAVVNTVVFLLSRSRRSFVLLVIVVLFTCAFVQYAFYADLTLPSLVACVATAALIMYRTYALSVMQASGLTAKSTAFGRVAATAVVMSAMACILGWVLFALIIAPLNPGHLTVHLFTEYRAFETIEIDNPMEIIKVEDPSMTSVNLTPEIIYGNLTTPVDGNDSALASAKEMLDETQEVLGTTDEYRVEADPQGAFIYALSTPSAWWLLYLAIPLVLIAAAVALRLFLRRRRRSAIAAQDPRSQVEAIYTAMLKRFDRVQRGKPAASTPFEFARDSQAAMEAFACGPHATWPEISALYEQARYGAQVPSKDELAGAWRFYDGFPSRVRLSVGVPKYIFRYFWVL